MKRFSTYFLPVAFVVYTAWLIGSPNVENSIFWFLVLYIPFCLGVIGNEIDKTTEEEQ